MGSNSLIPGVYLLALSYKVFIYCTQFPSLFVLVFLFLFAWFCFSIYLASSCLGTLLSVRHIFESKLMYFKVFSFVYKHFHCCLLLVVDNSKTLIFCFFLGICQVLQFKNDILKQGRSNGHGAILSRGCGFGQL